MASLKIDHTNQLFLLALELVSRSDRNIFLTGKAGTGKTTFLKYIRENLVKQMAVVAPTGVAAINAGGVTMHSLFQLPLQPFVPEGPGLSNGREEFLNAFELISRLKVQKEKQRMLQQLELLVIDEVSMVRADTLDAVDMVLRHFRQRPSLPFGGVQVLFIGDLFQLPPVMKEDTWNVLRNFYEGPYFFNSRVVSAFPPVYIEFDRIYRQSESRFIDLLNQVRTNTLDETGRALLEEQYKPDFRRDSADGFITLTTHNDKAREINSRELSGIGEPMGIYEAIIEGEFPESAFPADEQLRLKLGAQVMFIKNDSERDKRYFNGKIGIVTRLEPELIEVSCLDGSAPIEVEREKWENIRYGLNPNTRKMEPQLLGSFSQYPLRLAWAITIHKSQGLTFERAVIDAGSSFASGQVYVALSRCTTLEGMVLQSRITASSFFTDRRILDFAGNRAGSAELQEELLKASSLFHFRLLTGIFDFAEQITEFHSLRDYMLLHVSSFSVQSPVFLEKLGTILESVHDVSTRFREWLRQEFEREQNLENNQPIRDRFLKSRQYFMPRLNELIDQLRGPEVSTDSRLHAKEFNETARDLFADLSLRLKMMGSGQGIPSLDELLEIRSSFVAPAFSVNAYGGPSSSLVHSQHPVLYQQLRKVRDQICSRKNLPLYLVAGTKSLEEMSDRLPTTEETLLAISGFGASKVKNYGEEFLQVIRRYVEENNIVPDLTPVPPKPKKEAAPVRKKPNTRVESLRLFRVGQSIRQIAETRGLSVSTIETHLASCVSTGEIPVESLLSREKLLLIEPVIDSLGDKSISIIKQELGETVGFGDIRFTLAWKEFKRTQEELKSEK